MLKVCFYLCAWTWLTSGLSYFSRFVRLHRAGGYLGAVPDPEGQERPRHGQGTTVRLRHPRTACVLVVRMCVELRSAAVAVLCTVYPPCIATLLLSYFVPRTDRKCSALQLQLTSKHVLSLLQAASSSSVKYDASHATPFSRTRVLLLLTCTKPRRTHPVSPAMSAGQPARTRRDRPGGDRDVGQMVRP